MRKTVTDGMNEMEMMCKELQIDKIKVRLFSVNSGFPLKGQINM